MAKQVLILGGGISGLTTAWFLKERFGDQVSITILEGAERAGGWIRTDRSHGFLFEQGPRGLRLPSQDAMALIDSLGLHNEMIQAEQCPRYLWTKGHLRRLSIWQLLPFLPTLLREPFVAPSTHDDESVADFFTRRFSHPFMEQFIDPLVGGIYAGDPHHLSIRATFPRVAAWERTHRSVLKGWWRSQRKEGGLISFRNGMATLTETLAQKLEGQIDLKAAVQRIELSASGVSVAAGGKIYVADHLISTLPSQVLKPLLPNLPIPNPPAVSLSVVNAGFHKKLRLPHAFGYLVPSTEGEALVGTVFDSVVFPQHNHSAQETRLTLMFRGAINTDQPALDAMEKHLQIDVQPDYLHTYFAHKAVPQYPVGYLQTQSLCQKAIAKQRLPITLIGSSFHGVAVNDCIATARTVASEFRL